MMGQDFEWIQLLKDTVLVGQLPTFKGASGEEGEKMNIH